MYLTYELPGQKRTGNGTEHLINNAVCATHAQEFSYIKFLQFSLREGKEMGNLNANKNL